MPNLTRGLTAGTWSSSRPGRKLRSLLAGGLATLMAGPVGAGALSTTAGPADAASRLVPAAQLAYGQQGERQDVPWDEVGPGWALATWKLLPKPHHGGSHAQGAPGLGAGPAGETLFLVDPAGGRYEIAELPAADALVDWSGDGARALLVAVKGPNGSRQVLTDLDLMTGRTIGSFSWPTSDVTDLIAPVVGFTRPDGLAVLVAQGDLATHVTVARWLPDGTRQLTYPATFPGAGRLSGGFLEAPDGLELVLGAKYGLAVVDNAGQSLAELPVPKAQFGCYPVRWWAAGVVVTSCDTGLWFVPLSGARPTLVSDQGALNAWRVGSAIYLQEAACGTEYLAKLGQNGKAFPVDVPEVNGYHSVTVLGTYAGRFAMLATLGCDFSKPGPGGPGPSLLWYTPGARTVSPVLGPPLNGGSVSAALLFGEQLPGPAA